MWAAAVLATTLALSTEGAVAARGTANTSAPGKDDERDAEDEDVRDDAPEGEDAEGGEPEGDAEGEPEGEDAENEDTGDDDADPELEARLRGRVRAIGSTDGLSDALLIWDDGSAPVVVDDKGEFSVRLPPGKRKLIVRRPGYTDLAVEVELEPNQDLEMEYYLEPNLDDPGYRTIVRSERAVAVSSTLLRDAEAHELPGTLGDPFRVVANLPGASQVVGFLPYVVVRGAAPGNTGYYLDGTRVPIVAHVAIGPSVLHPQFIDSIEYYPAGAPVRLGRYASGIIEAHTRPARRDRVHGEVEVRVTDAGGLVEVPFSRPRDRDCVKRTKTRGKALDAVCPRGPARGSLTLAGRYSYTATILNAVLSEAKIDYWDFQARLDHDLTPRARFTSFLYGSYDDLATRLATGELETAARFNFYRFDNRVRQRLRNGGTANYALVFGLDRGSYGTLRTDEWRVAPRIDVEIPTRVEALRVGFGLDQELQIFKLAPGISTSEDLQDFALLFNDRVVNATGIYLEFLFEKNGFEARPGIRADFYAQMGTSPYSPRADGLAFAFGVDPRLLLRERVSKRWVLKQAVGVYHQPPGSPLPVPAIENFGFERGLQRNVQASIGYEVEIVPEHLELQQQVYGGRLDNLQDYELDRLNENTSLSELDDVVARASGWTYGLETKLRIVPDDRVFGWVSYTLARSDRIYQIGGTAPSSWDQRHVLNVVLGYNVTNSLSLGFRVHYNSGRPYTIRDASESQAEALARHRNNARLPAFFQLDLRIAYSKLWPRWQLQVYLDIINSTYSNEVFRCSEDGQSIDDLVAFRRMIATEIDPSTALVGCTELGFRYVVPMLGIRAKW